MNYINYINFCKLHTCTCLTQNLAIFPLKFIIFSENIKTTLYPMQSKTLTELRRPSVQLILIFLYFAKLRYVTGTQVKAFQYKKVTDPSTVEWSDDFPTLARVVFSHRTNINLRTYCRVAADCETNPGKFVKVCAYTLDHKKHECVNVTSNSKKKEFTLIPMTVVYNDEDHEAVGTMAASINKYLSVMELYCESTASAGHVYRTSNRLLLMDLRDYFSDSPFKQDSPSPLGHDYHALQCTGNGSKAVNMLKKFKDTSLPLMPITYPQIEYYACSTVKAWKQCYADKQNDIFNQFNFFEWPIALLKSQNGITLNFKWVPESIKQKLTQYYIVCFIDGVIAQPPSDMFTYSNKAKASDTDFKLEHPNKEGQSVSVWNDSSVNHFFITVIIPTGIKIKSIAWSYMKDYERTQENLINGVRNEKLSVEVSRSGERLSFSGPYSLTTNGRYTVKVSAGDKSLSGFYKVQVVPYPIASSSFAPSTLSVKSVVFVQCSHMISSLPLLSSLSIFDVYAKASMGKVRLGSRMALSSRYHVEARDVKRHHSRSNRKETKVHLKMSSSNNNQIILNRDYFLILMENNYLYKHGEENCHTVTCYSHLLNEKDNDKQTFPFLVTTVNVLAMPPMPLYVKLKANPCVDICWVICDFKNSALYQKNKLLFRFSWKLGDQNTSSKNFTALSLANKHEKDFKIYCRMDIFESGSRKFLWIKTGRLHLHNVRVSLSALRNNVAGMSCYNVMYIILLVVKIPYL